MTEEEKKAYQKAYRKKYYAEHKEKAKADAKQYRDENKEKHNKQKREHYYKNRDTIYQKKKDRLNTDSEFRLINSIRNRTRLAVKELTLSKDSTTTQMLGCDKRTLMEWLQWSGELYDTSFNIYNYSGEQYHIDHIKTFEDVAKGIYTMAEVCHYTNLQMLPADINLLKGGTSWNE